MEVEKIRSLEEDFQKWDVPLPLEVQPTIF